MTAKNVEPPMTPLTLDLDGTSVRPSLRSAGTLRHAWRLALAFTSWAKKRLRDLKARLERLLDKLKPQGGLAQPSIYAFN